MKLLFVCRGNVGRSQMATTIYNSIHPNGSDSAGTVVVNFPGETVGAVGEGSNNIITAMKEIGFDITNNPRDVIDEKSLSKYDKIIIMAEHDSVQDYLKNSPKSEFWDVENPKGMNLEDTRIVRDIIAQKIKQLTA